MHLVLKLKTVEKAKIIDIRRFNIDERVVFHSWIENSKKFGHVLRFLWKIYAYLEFCI